jgi:dethiobiotin synthetase
MAARLEGRDLRMPAIVEFCSGRVARSRADILVVEGVGGVMSPIAEGATGLQLMTGLDLPVVLVGGTYLGSISHTLTALETTRAHGLRVDAVVISQSRDPGAPSFEDTLSEVASFARDTTVLGAPLDDLSGWPRRLCDAL